MQSRLTSERIIELREQGIIFITKADVERMTNENVILKSKSHRKLVNIMVLSLIYSFIMVSMSIDVLIPRIGDIGAYKPDGEVVLLEPRIDPPVEITHAYNYAVDVVQTIRTYRFLTYIDSILASEKYFSENGFEAYLFDLDSTGHIQRIMTNKENRLSIVSSKQNIWARRAIEGSYAYWFVSVKLLTRIEKLNGEDELINETVDVKLKEVPRTVSKHGLLIEYIRD
ncbi:MAG: hypothetical protein ACJAXJ_001181 [Colwellia sp.]|jgi:hypothetical protein